jgi:uncharacterized membrane protein
MPLPGHGLLGWARRVIAAHRRLLTGAVCGAASYPLLPRSLGSQTRAVIAWDVGVVVFLALSAFLFATERAIRMRVDAERQQEGEWTVFWLTMAATGFSFAAIVGEFSNSKDLPAAQKGLHVALVAATLLVSWLMTHTTFAFRYAHEYYEAPAGAEKVDGGLQFPGEDQPDYLDFLYFSMVLGMTFQVSDVQITSRKFRRLATVHGLLSFLFNTIILALTVNIAAGLL